MLKTIEIRETFRDTHGRAETLQKYSADDIKVEISDDKIMIYVDGNVINQK